VRKYVPLDTVPIVFIESRVYEDRVARLYARWVGVEVVGVRGAGVVRGQQSGERGLLSLPLKVGRIHVVDVAARRRHRFGARAHRHDAFGTSRDAIRIRQHEPRFIRSCRLELEEAAGEAVRRDVLQRVLVDALVADAKQRRPALPHLLALLAIGDGDRRVAIVVAVDHPLEAERNQRRRLGDEVLRDGLVGG
jgi:hypothetical protein